MELVFEVMHAAWSFIMLLLHCTAAPLYCRSIVLLLPCTALVSRAMQLLADRRTVVCAV